MKRAILPEQKEIENSIFLSEKICRLDEQISALNTENANLKEQLSWLKRQVFGKRSERNIADISADQLEFEGFPVIKANEEEKRIIPSHERKKPNRKGQDKIILPPDLPVETTVLDIPEEEKVCKKTGKKLVRIGEEVSYKLAHKPGSYYLKEIIRPKYAIPGEEESRIKTAELADSIIPRGRADASLLAEIVTKKFGDHLPLYRIEEGIKREKIQISRKLLSQWVIKTGLALEPVYLEMKKRVEESGHVFMDEIPVKLQQKGKCRQAFIWCLCGGPASAQFPYRVYSFRKSRSHDHALDLLGNFEEILHSDKYGVYQKLAKQKVITWCPCWAHIRRKFFEASESSSLRAWILRKVRYLYMLERVGWNRSAEERLKIRIEKEVPIIDEIIDKMKKELHSSKILPKSKLGEAVRYLYGLIPYIKNYTTDAFAKIDNNVVERAIRPVAIGRKNWLFFGSVNGGKAGGILLSLIQTCRGLGVNPREYMEDVIRRIMSHPAKKIHELLPDEWLLHKKSPITS